MNPSYMLRIEITVAAHKSHRDVIVTKQRVFDFVPVEGLRIKFRDGDDTELDITLVNLHYDYDTRMFVEQQIDEALYDELRDPDNPACNITAQRMTEYLDAVYINQEFERTP